MKKTKKKLQKWALVAGVVARSLALDFLSPVLLSVPANCCTPGARGVVSSVLPVLDSSLSSVRHSGDAKSSKDQACRLSFHRGVIPLSDNTFISGIILRTNVIMNVSCSMYGEGGT
mmetsp:Transcript_81423/g.186282  ORF Transcript_81423/g.186282 Transcript_81423/m.186282 type:complete len:116 (+) Transcript_81423:321-668(+)